MKSSKKYNYTETQKIYLRKAFERMLENGEDFAIMETAEMDWPNMTAVRTTFRLSITETGKVEQRA